MSITIEKVLCLGFIWIDYSCIRAQWGLMIYRNTHEKAALALTKALKDFCKSIHMLKHDMEYSKSCFLRRFVFNKQGNPP